MITKFSDTIIEELKYYVYIYIDPRNDEIFYIGKGKRNRCFDHLSEKSDSEKVKRIELIRSDNQEPIIEMLIHGVTDDVAKKVEATVIDIIDIKKLTNKSKGHSSSKIGRMSLEKIVSIYSPEKAKITERALLIKLSQSFTYSMTENELYDATRQFWRIGENRENVEYVFAVFDGIIQEIYKIISWHIAGTTFSSRQATQKEKGERWEFIGQIADIEMQKKYRYKDVSDITNKQTPFYYLNI